MPPSPLRRDLILASALELFCAKGFANVSTRDLADHAGISRSHIYHYFTDWDELRRDAFGWFAAGQLDGIRAVVDRQPPDSALGAFLKDCLPEPGDDSWALWIDAWDEAMHDPELAKSYLSLNQQWQDILAGIVQRGIDAGIFQCQSPQRVARQLFALAMGYANDLMLLQSPDARLLMEQELTEVAGLLLRSKAAAT